MCADRLRLKIALELDDFSLALEEEVSATGVTAVFGPSGSGKSSLLRTIAGFEKPRTGLIGLGRDTWFDSEHRLDVPAHRRPVGFLFQDARLFSQLHVADNLAFAERRSKAEGAGFHLQELIRIFDLQALLGRHVDKLSGGERQRVALARTLLTRPRLLLLDEPLCALDQDRKAEILPYLDRAQERFHLPTLYVSHDIDEVAHIADHVMVLIDGRVQMRGSVMDVFDKLDLALVAERYEQGVLVEGRVEAQDAERKVTKIGIGEDILTLPLAAELKPGSSVRLRVRSRDVALARKRPEAISIRNILEGRLIGLHEQADSGQVEARVRLRSVEIRSRLTHAAVEELELAPNMDVFVLIKSVGLVQM